MKKILLMSVLCLAIVACGKKEEAKQETAETTNVTQKKVLKYLTHLWK